MKTYIPLLTLLLLFSCNQELTPETVLDKSIAFHDPDSLWPEFNNSLTVRMEIPDRSDRLSKINIDLAGERFSVSATRDSITIDYKVDGDTCEVLFNGSAEFSEEEKTEHRL